MDNNPGYDCRESTQGAPDGASRDAPDDATASVIVDQQGRPYSQKNNAHQPIERIKRLFRRVPHGERWMIALTAIVAFTTISQAVQSCNNNRSTSNQVDRLITAADRIDNAADSFSASARSINDGVNNAVRKLNLQANETTRLATAAEAANSNALEGDRPWFHGLISVTGFEVGKQAQVNVTFINEGRRPATVILARQNVRRYEVFPEKPFYVDSGAHHGEFVVPTTGIGSSQWLSRGSLTDTDIATITTSTSAVYIYGEILYRDTRTGETHFSHVCDVYAPPRLSNPGGWGNCSTYNDGD